MARIRFFGTILAISAFPCWCFPAAAWGDWPGAPTRTQAIFRDVELGPGGEFAGQLVDAQNRPLARRSVVLLRGKHEIARLATDADGRYMTHGLQGGVYQAVAGRTSELCRCWTHGAAPPAAARQLLLIDGGVVERGQQPIQNLIFSDPVLIGLFVGAAIAVPIAVHQSQEDAAPGS